MSLTPLQRHAAFFDPEGTGSVTPRQTIAGLARLGVPWWWQLVLTPIINGFLGYLTQRKLSFTIRVERIADGKHPFDSGTFDDAGAIDDAAFEAVFASAADRDVVTAKEMRAVIVARGNRRPQMGKLAGVLGNWFSGKEVRLLFCVAGDTTATEDGASVPAIRRRTLRRFYEGELLPAIARARLVRAALDATARVGASAGRGGAGGGAGAKVTSARGRAA